MSNNRMAVVRDTGRGAGLHIGAARVDRSQFEAGPHTMRTWNGPSSSLSMSYAPAIGGKQGPRPTRKAVRRHTETARQRLILSQPRYIAAQPPVMLSSSWFVSSRLHESNRAYPMSVPVPRELRRSTTLYVFGFSPFHNWFRLSSRLMPHA
jgi:hypothetical protein